MPAKASTSICRPWPTRSVLRRLSWRPCDDRPFGKGEPAVLFHYSPDRRGEHPEQHLVGYGGILQADAYAGFASLYKPARPRGAVTEALCWAHARSGFFELADLARVRKGPPSPLALEAVRQMIVGRRCEDGTLAWGRQASTRGSSPDH